MGRAVDAVAEPGFAAETETITVGPLQLLFGAYGAQTVRRTAALCRTSPLDGFNVILPLTARISGSWATVEPGELALCDLDAIAEHRSSRGTMALFAVSRSLALAHGLDPRTLHGTTLPARAAAMLSAHLQQIRRAAPSIAVADGPRLARTVMDLLVVALASADRIATPPIEPVAGTLKLRAEAAISGAGADPALSVETLCRTLGVSRATLYRLFAGEGGVQRRIRHERLLAARQALGAADASIADVAERYGFGDASRFNRSFREAFGMTPREWQAGDR